jgi:UDP-glucose 4-epimerase
VARLAASTGSRRILITGLSSYWGGRLAQELERAEGVEAIVGVDTDDPRHELHRTEFVRVDIDQKLLRRIIRAAAIDTVIDTRLIADPPAVPRGGTREVNVAGTAELLAACSGAASTVRKLVFKSSAQYYGCEADAPSFFSEDMRRSGPVATTLEREVVDAEAAVAAFAASHPDATVTILRCAEALGAELRSASVSLLSLPVVPSILGFDPRWQFVHADDVIGALSHCARHALPGAYNVAADGVLALSEIASLLGKPLLPVLPPWGTVFAAAQLRRLGLPVPVELMRRLRFGQGLDNRRVKSAGYAFRYTTRETVLKLRAQQRLRPLLRSGEEGYRYEREVEEFLRWSPSVRGADGGRAAPGPAGTATSPYDELSEGELIELISSLEPDALRHLRVHEQAHQRRAGVLAALDHNLERRASSEHG